MRYFDTSTRSEVIPGLHPTDIESVVGLPDDHPFFKPLPAGYKVDYDLAGLPIIVLDGLTYEQVWADIKAERDRRRFDGGVEVGGHWFLSTAIAGSEYTSLALISVGMPDATVLRKDWRTLDGAVIDMTPPLVKQILTAGFFAIAAIDDAAMAHKLAMEASEVPGDYDFTGGWPAVFVATPIEE